MIYTKTFIKQAEEAIQKLDDAAGIIEEQVMVISRLKNDLVQGKEENLNELTSLESATSSFDNHLDNMYRKVMDIYVEKNDLLDWLEKIGE